MNKRSRSRSLTSHLVIALAAIGCLVPNANACGRRHFWRTAPCTPYVPSEVSLQTVFRSGTDQEYLEVRAVGPELRTLEIYLHSASQDRDEFARDVLPGDLDLRDPGSIVLAPQNSYGTFAVRFGPARDTFKVYGWKKGATSPVSYPKKKTLADGGEGDPITLEPGRPVTLEWVTPRILKATAGAKSSILRFTSADDPWGPPLYQSP